jgi:hypothetical protein
MLLLRSLFRKVIRRGALTIIARAGRAHYIGTGRIEDRATSPRAAEVR